MRRQIQQATLGCQGPYVCVTCFACQHRVLDLLGLNGVDLTVGRENSPKQGVKLSLAQCVLAVRDNNDNLSSRIGAEIIRGLRDSVEQAGSALRLSKVVDGSDQRSYIVCQRLGQNHVGSDAVDRRFVDRAYNAAKESNGCLFLELARGGQALTVVEQQGQRNRHLGSVEIADRSRLPVNSQLKVFQLEVYYRASLSINYRGRNGDEIRTDPHDILDTNFVPCGRVRSGSGRGLRCRGRRRGLVHYYRPTW